MGCWFLSILLNLEKVNLCYTMWQEEKAKGQFSMYNPLKFAGGCSIVFFILTVDTEPVCRASGLL